MTPEQVERVAKARAAFRENIAKARECERDEKIMRKTLEYQVTEGSLDVVIVLATALADLMDAAGKMVSEAN